MMVFLPPHEQLIEGKVWNWHFEVAYDKIKYNFVFLSDWRFWVWVDLKEKSDAPSQDTLGGLQRRSEALSV